MSKNYLLESLKDTLEESLVKAEEVEKFGTNVPEYDNGKIDYNPATRSYFTIHPIPQDGDDVLYLLIMVDRVSGRVTFTSTMNAYVGRLLRSPMLRMRRSIVNAIPYLGRSLGLLEEIMRRYRARIPRLVFSSQYKIVSRYYVFLFRSPDFKKLVRKYRMVNYRTEEIEDDDGNKTIVYAFEKDR